jgi:hypothetical protein
MSERRGPLAAPAGRFSRQVDPALSHFWGNFRRRGNVAHFLCMKPSEKCVNLHVRRSVRLGPGFASECPSANPDAQSSSTHCQARTRSRAAPALRGRGVRRSFSPGSHALSGSGFSGKLGAFPAGHHESRARGILPIRAEAAAGYRAEGALDAGRNEADQGERVASHHARFAG